jgi:hypothetical protein
MQTRLTFPTLSIELLNDTVISLSRKLCLNNDFVSDLLFPFFHLGDGESRRPQKPAFEDEWKYTHVQDLKA